MSEGLVRYKRPAVSLRDRISARFGKKNQIAAIKVYIAIPDDFTD